MDRSVVIDINDQSRFLDLTIEDCSQLVRKLSRKQGILGNTQLVFAIFFVFSMSRSLFKV